MTSSTCRRIPYLRHRRSTSGRYSSGGTATPTPLITGSTIHFRHCLRSLAEDRRLHRLDAGEPTARIAQAEWAAIAIGRRYMREVAGIRLELCLALAHAAGIQGCERRAVIGIIAADRLEAEFPGTLVLLVLAGDLEAGLVRFRSRVDEISGGGA